jgi:hypothetical protein
MTAAKADANQSAIMKIMRKIGLKVVESKFPLDLQVAKSFITVQVDIKNPERRPSARRLTPNERKFYDDNKNDFLICVIETAQDVIDLNRAMTKGINASVKYCEENMRNHFDTCYATRGKK